MNKVPETPAPGRVLFHHGESGSYIEAIGAIEIAKWWDANDGLLADVTGIEEHEKAFAESKDAP